MITEWIHIGVRIESSFSGNTYELIDIRDDVVKYTIVANSKTSVNIGFIGNWDLCDFQLLSGRSYIKILP